MILSFRILYQCPFQRVALPPSRFDDGTGRTAFRCLCKGSTPITTLLGSRHGMCFGEASRLAWLLRTLYRTLLTVTELPQITIVLNLDQVSQALIPLVSFAHPFSDPSSLGDGILELRKAYHFLAGLPTIPCRLV